jgi:hypothetical protein
MDDDKKIDRETGELLDDDGEPIEEEVAELMENHDIDKDTAEKAQELIDEGIDEDDAIELAEEI